MTQDNKQGLEKMMVMLVGHLQSHEYIMILLAINEGKFESVTRIYHDTFK